MLWTAKLQLRYESPEKLFFFRKNCDIQSTSTIMQHRDSSEEANLGEQNTGTAAAADLLNEGFPLSKNI